MATLEGATREDCLEGEMVLTEGGSILCPESTCSSGYESKPHIPACLLCPNLDLHYHTPHSQPIFHQGEGGRALHRASVMVGVPDAWNLALRNLPWRVSSQKCWGEV